MSRKLNSKIFAGTSGLVVPESNKRSFPPAYQNKSRLAYYASLFNSIEINSSFKKVPMTRTVLRWAAEVHNDFRFTFKCPQQITHNKDLTYDPAHIQHFLQVISHTGTKRGCLLVQFPGKLTIAHKGPLENMLKVIKKADPERSWKVAMEFRNTSWYVDEIFDLLHQYQAGLVVHDLPLTAPPVTDTTDFMYIRFHGTEKGYRGSYSDDFLFDYAQRIRAWKKSGKEVYIYFNNTLGDAARNLVTLNNFIETNS